MNATDLLARMTKAMHMPHRAVHDVTKEEFDKLLEQYDLWMARRMERLPMEHYRQNGTNFTLAPDPQGSNDAAYLVQFYTMLLEWSFTQQWRLMNTLRGANGFSFTGKVIDLLIQFGMTDAYWNGNRLSIDTEQGPIPVDSSYLSDVLPFVYLTPTDLLAGDQMNPYSADDYIMGLAWRAVITTLLEEATKYEDLQEKQ